MTITEMFGPAKWVAAGPYAHISPATPDENGTPHFPVLRGHFTLRGGERVTLRAVGLGVFTCRINGALVSEDQFLPLATDYQPRENYPAGETLHGHRLYVPQYDITPLVHAGDNLITLHFGGGWYNFDDGRGNIRGYGTPKAIWYVRAEGEGACTEFGSSEADLVRDSFVKTSYMTRFEEQDFCGFDDAVYSPDFSEEGLRHAVAAPAPDTEYLFSDCPADRAQEWEPRLLAQEGDTRYYDAGRNISGYPVLTLPAGAKGTVEVSFSEEEDGTGKPHPDFCHGQYFRVRADGGERTVYPHFTWFGFRYFSVRGAARDVRVRFVHTDVRVNSGFRTDSTLLNWIYTTFLHTELCNMHGGIPSDCPHIERRGYTGDGELTCRAVMTVMDARAFYRKWIDDIADCQDVLTGHIQYTAPYVRSGGGPGAWGCAIVEVPWQYYRFYGDPEPAVRLYPQMLRYFDYLEAHSAFGLVVSDKAGEWCLGDWCTLEPVCLPAPFVNNYYYIKAMENAIEIARLAGREEDIPLLRSRIEARGAALTAAYFNTWDGNFLAARQGANAFMLDIGLGDARTLRNLIEYYRKLGHLDTGICGTDVLIRVLFAHGAGDLALSLLMSEHPSAFGGWREAGATTFWEYWRNSTRSRSHSHPMFGSPVAYFFEYLLGIRPLAPGYVKVCVEPYLSPALGTVEGTQTVPAGEIRVLYRPAGEGETEAEIVIPEGLDAAFRYGHFTRPLTAGCNRFRIPRA